MYRIIDLHFIVKFINQIYSEIIKKKKNMRDPQINSKGSTKLFLDFFILKKLCLARYQNKKG
jgi:hypothetical protein